MPCVEAEGVGGDSVGGRGSFIEVDSWTSLV